MEKMASHILKFYEFAKKNPQIKNKNFAIDVCPPLCKVVEKLFCCYLDRNRNKRKFLFHFVVLMEV